MLLSYKNRKIKLIPVKYRHISNITDYLEDFDHLRLSDDERKSLEHALFVQAASGFIASLAQNEHLVHEHVGNAHPVYAVKADTSDGQTYYALKMSNNVSVRCSEDIYRMSPIKQNIWYTNSLSKQLAPPPVEQLRMFEL